MEDVCKFFVGSQVGCYSEIGMDGNGTLLDGLGTPSLCICGSGLTLRRFGDIGHLVWHPFLDHGTNGIGAFRLETLWCDLQLPHDG